MTDFNSTIPFNVRLIDESGRLDRSWIYFFIQLLNRTGGNSGIGTGDVQAEAQAAQSTANTALADAILANTAVAAETTRAEAAEAALQLELTPGQLPATGTNDNANVGKLGEYISHAGTQIALTTSTLANLGSVVLTGGDWDVDAQLVLNGGTATLVTGLVVGISNVGTAFDTSAFAYSETTYGGVGVFPTAGSPTLEAGPKRVSINANTTLYVLGQAGFSTGTLSASGAIQARRAR